MKQANKFIAFIIITVLTLLAYPSAVQAFPPLPSSIYGTVKANNANVADGTLVEASINNQVVAQGYTQTYQGDFVYSLDVPGDDTSTAVIEGGKEGDTISFKIGGVSAVEKGIWHSATNVMLEFNDFFFKYVEHTASNPNFRCYANANHYFVCHRFTHNHSS